MDIFDALAISLEDDVWIRRNSWKDEDPIAIIVIAGAIARYSTDAIAMTTGVNLPCRNSILMCTCYRQLKWGYYFTEEDQDANDWVTCSAKLIQGDVHE